MKIRVLTVGTRMPEWVESGWEEYNKRMPPELRVQSVEIPLGSRGKSQSPKKAIEAEGVAILKAIGEKDYVIALDVIGRGMSTKKLATSLMAWQMEGRNVSFLIGGPDGLSSDCIKRADMRWSLSDLTMPHPLVRIILMEQLYRAWTITTNHPYHRQ